MRQARRRIEDGTQVISLGQIAGLGGDAAGDGLQLVPSGEIMLQDHELPLQFDRDLDNRRQNHHEGPVLLALADGGVEGLDDLGRTQELVEVPQHQDRRPIGRCQGVRRLDGRQRVVCGRHGTGLGGLAVQGDAPVDVPACHRPVVPMAETGDLGDGIIVLVRCGPVHPGTLLLAVGAGSMTHSDSPQDNQSRVSVSSRTFTLPRNVKLLGLASLLNDITSEMIYPLLPQFLLAVLGGNRVHLGVIEGMADLTASLLKLWSGGRSDRAGRRKGFVVFGYALATLARPLIGLAAAPWQVFAARTADRAGKGVRTSPRDALIADSTEPGARGYAFGFHRAMDHLGAAIGPLLASAFLLAWPGQVRALFLLTVLPGLVVVALLVLGLHETTTTGPPTEKLRLALAPFGRDFRLLLLALVVFTLGNASDAFLLVRAGELGVPTPLLPILWCVFHVAKSGGNLLASRAVDRLGPRPLILGGWGVYALIYLAFALATEAWHVWALFLGYAAFYALTEPAEKALIADLVGGERKGLAFGWYNFAIGVAALSSSLIFGALYEEFGALVAFGWGAALALFAALMLAGVRREGKTPAITRA
jgi:MFS family permease